MKRIFDCRLGKIPRFARWRANRCNKRSEARLSKSKIETRKSRIENTRGFALVIVLGILVLITVLAVGFLMRAGTERTAASRYQASALSRQLADTAVSLVQGQINMAVTQGANVAWVSQPGMVRTFDTSGNLLKAYKLYSADAMVSSAVGITAGKSDDEAPAAWAASPALWSDLNAPVTGADGTVNYPIVDPTAANGTIVPGYSLASPPGATSAQPAPMPVRWLYVLRDGQAVLPSGGSGNTATFAGAVVPTKANPIVGRVAFWTDDDTCKVNLNTAGEGAYWDVPRASTTGEAKLAKYQPATKEFQRYPGHPATTSLSAVLPGLTLQDILSLTPRYKYGNSSQGGAVVPPNGGINLNPKLRLLPSLDELIFNPSRTANTLLNRALLESRRFLLTAHSRAPETNLFNLPRVAAWPLYQLGAGNSLADLNTLRTTAFDRLIAFCASTGGVDGPLRPYFFQRESAASPTSDMAITRNTQLYSYLQTLTGSPIPGFGGNFSTKYGTDRDQILTEIFDYIRCTNLYDDYLVGGNQFTTARPSPNSAVVPAGHGWVTPGRHPNGTQGMGRFFTISEMGLIFICNADAANAQSNIPATNPALGGVALTPGQKKIQALFAFEPFSVMQGWVPLGQNWKVEISGLNQFMVSTGTSAAVSLGFPASATLTMNSSIMEIFQGRQWGASPDWRAPFYKPAPAQYPFIGIPITITAPAGSTMAFTGGLVTVRILTADNVEVQRLQVNMPSSLPATPFPVPNLVTAGTNFGWGTQTIATSAPHWWRFYSPTQTSGDGAGRLTTAANLPCSDWVNWDFSPSEQFSGSIIRTDDVVRTILVKHGDFRLVAARADLNDPTNAVFVKHPEYDNQSVRLAHDFSNSGNQCNVVRRPNVTSGKYVNSITYAGELMPDIPSNVATVDTATGTGDFDTGVAGTLDGAYCNKPDEGNTRNINNGSSLPYFDNGWEQAAAGQTFFSPNRQIPSPVMFGSLPTGVLAGKPWQTLLFRPLAQAESGHKGATAPKDHLLLDFFWMPVVEPYAISDRFSTAGKINMNTQILPFTSIKRSTGLYALLKAEKIAAFPNDAASINKGRFKFSSGNSNNALAVDYRNPVNIPETLKQFDDKFTAGQVFRSASEICDLYIVPQGQTAAGMPVFWNSNRLTGDNVREKIYATLYPRLTTKSNTYTVHMRAQSLRQSPGSSPNTWTEGRDQVTGEYRGATSIERFVNANNPDIPDYVANASNLSNLPSLDTFYRWRIIENRQFAP